MSNLPHFENDLNAAMMYKGQHPECFLIVSLEDSNSINYDDFWSNSSIILALYNIHIITRLSESKMPEGYNQFISIFKITDVPSIVIFGQNTPNVTKIFYPYPNPADLVDYFSQTPKATANQQQDFPAPPPIEENILQQEPNSQQSQKPKPHQQVKKEAEQPKRPPKTTTKISVQTPAGQSFNHVFEKTDTIGDLKHWLESEFGSDVFPDLIIAHTNSPLPDDDSLTLENADLCPSALLKLLTSDQILDIHVEDGSNDVPNESFRRNCCKCNCRCGTCNCFNSRGFKWFRVFFSLLNPWGDDPGPNNRDEDPNGDNDIWQYRPNPQLTQNIRDALNMQRRNMGTPNRFAEV